MEYDAESRLNEREGNMMPNNWQIQCDAARGIAERFGTANALQYLVGEKFLNHLQAAETNSDFRDQVPAFAAEIATTFDRTELENYLANASRQERFDPSIYEKEEPSVIEDERQDNVRRVANELLLLEQAKGWLLSQ